VEYQLFHALVVDEEVVKTYLHLFMVEVIQGDLEEVDHQPILDLELVELELLEKVTTVDKEVPLMEEEAEVKVQLVQMGPLEMEQEEQDQLVL
jgi:hypothetical protein